VDDTTRLVDDEHTILTCPQLQVTYEIQNLVAASPTAAWATSSGKWTVLGRRDSGATMASAQGLQGLLGCSTGCTAAAPPVAIPMGALTFAMPPTSPRARKRPPLGRQGPGAPA